jgi:hypothetical protein
MCYLICLGCHWWIGVNNWSNGSPGSNTDGVYASDQSFPAIMQVIDGDDGNNQNCVDIRSSNWSWGDLNCQCTRTKFICERQSKEMSSHNAECQDF